MTNEGKKPEILVADDEEDILFFFEQFFARHHINVIGATNGQDALRLIEQHRPDLIMSDIRMPIMNGFELIRAIRHGDTSLRPSIPAIALTAFADLDIVAAALAAGFDTCLLKPFEGAEILGTVRHLIRLDHQRMKGAG